MLQVAFIVVATRLVSPARAVDCVAHVVPELGARLRRTDACPLLVAGRMAASRQADQMHNDRGSHHTPPFQSSNKPFTSTHTRTDEHWKTLNNPRTTHTMFNTSTKRTKRKEHAMNTRNQQKQIELQKLELKRRRLEAVHRKAKKANDAERSGWLRTALDELNAEIVQAIVDE